jgi:predicted amidohydrolase YtcJ
VPAAPDLAPGSPGTLLRQVEVQGRVQDVRFAAGVVTAVGALPALPGDTVVDGAGGALLPGLHDHHLHLLALAAAQASVDVSDGLAPLRDQPGTTWLRAVRWAGDGDRHALDAVVAHRPVRVQHRSGALWVLNSRAVQELGLRDVQRPGVERDERDEPTGRLWREDAWLAARLGQQLPDLAAVGVRLARLGLTGVTDATPDLDEQTCALLRRSVPQHLQLLGDPHGTGPVKVVLPDHELPAYDALCATLRQVRPRPVAVHCVTREALLLLLTALDEVGHVVGDRVEHGSLVPADVLDRLPPVVTQPGFLSDRGDDYLRDVPAEDRPDLYRYRSLVDAGRCVVPSSDAPFGPLDPWAVLRAARDRTTATGRQVGPGEAVPVAQALDGMLRPLHDLTAPARTVFPGAPADLVLLAAPLAQVLEAPDADLVVRTWIAGTEIG